MLLIKSLFSFLSGESENSERLYIGLKIKNRKISRVDKAKKASMNIAEKHEAMRCVLDLPGSGTAGS